MRAIFRADSSLNIGTGHVMRCLALADTLSKRGVQCIFICRDHEGHSIQLIDQYGYQSLILPTTRSDTKYNLDDTPYSRWLATDWITDAEDTRQVLLANRSSELPNWLIVDHYAIDQRWEGLLRSYVQHIMVIDDLADRYHNCDVLLDQNLARKSSDYKGLLMPNTATLIGPQFSLLRPEFVSLRSKSLDRRNNNPNLKTILISMGGIDRLNATEQALDVLKGCTFQASLQIIVIMGSGAPWISHVEKKAAEMPWPTKVMTGVTNMAQLMAVSDLAIGAAGGTAWERCCLGLPSLVFSLAENQTANAAALDNVGAAIALDNFQQIREIFDSWYSTRQTEFKLMMMSQAAAAVSDGYGCSRTVDYMMENTNV
jgi:UDP-2,4-diacetamido-2,4,6-trideoxy-beta-L-altropyranose hydrolase